MLLELKNILLILIILLPQFTYSKIPSLFNIVFRYRHPHAVEARETVMYSYKVDGNIDLLTSFNRFCFFHSVDDDLCNLMYNEKVIIEYNSFITNRQLLIDNNIDNIDIEHSKDNNIDLYCFDNESGNKRGGYHDGGRILTIVSGWWNITTAKVSINKYFNEWFPNSLQLNMPYIFFTDPKNFPIFAKYRNGRCTNFISSTIDDFKTKSTYKKEWIDPLHVPSPELGMIWLEKVNLLYEAAKNSDSEYFAWVDAALNMMRNKLPPKEEWSESVIRSLPTNRISYSYIKDQYGTHSFSGGILVMHRSVIPLIHHLFYKEYEIFTREKNDWRCGSDQIIFTSIREKYPELFHSAAYEYGDMNYLWANKYNNISFVENVLLNTSDWD